MLSIIAIGLMLSLVTTFMHALSMLAGFKALLILHVDRWDRNRRLVRETTVCALVLMLSLTSLLEAVIWALAYRQLGAFADFDTALYFSMVTFTTLGYGDITLEPRWQLLSALEAANGIMMFGWTTALLFAFVQRVYRRG